MASLRPVAPSVMMGKPYGIIQFNILNSPLFQRKLNHDNECKEQAQRPGLFELHSIGLPNLIASCSGTRPQVIQYLLVVAAVFIVAVVTFSWSPRFDG